jgi:hypothetical protein
MLDIAEETLDLIERDCSLVRTEDAMWKRIGEKKPYVDRMASSFC